MFNLKKRKMKKNLNFAGQLTNCQELVEQIKRLAHNQFNEDVTPELKDRLEKGEKVELCYNHSGKRIKGTARSISQAETYYQWLILGIVTNVMSAANALTDEVINQVSEAFVKDMNLEDILALDMEVNPVKESSDDNGVHLRIEAMSLPTQVGMNQGYKPFGIVIE